MNAVMLMLASAWITGFIVFHYSTKEPATEPKLALGTCYYEGGDFGGTPMQISCVQAIGPDGFLRCDGLLLDDDTYYWYSCQKPTGWKSLRRQIVISCPIKCLGPDKSRSAE